MRHSLLYSGAFDTNFAKLKPGATSFEGSDGAAHNVDWPAGTDGVRVSFMEKPGKHFVAVRVQDGTDDIVLENPLLLDPGRHLGYGKRFGPEAIDIPDDTAKAILEDAIARNDSQRNELARIRLRLSSKKPNP